MMDMEKRMLALIALNMEETICGKPHNNGDNRPEVCTECMMIKLGL